MSKMLLKIKIMIKDGTFANGSMFGYVLIGILVVAIVYFYSRDDRQFLSTASAIQQIWSGSCRLRCREAKKIAITDSKNDESVDSDQNIASSSHSPVPSHCICESCPCALVENFIQTCSPAAKTYAFIMGIIFQAYYDFIEVCIDMFDRVALVLQTQENGTAQSGQVEPNKVKIKKIAGTKVDFSGRKDEDKGAGAEPGTSGASDEADAKTTIELDQKNDEFAGTDCPSCAEKGLTCIGKCPAERHKKD